MNIRAITATLALISFVAMEMNAGAVLDRGGAARQAGNDESYNDDPAPRRRQARPAGRRSQGRSAERRLRALEQELEDLQSSCATKSDRIREIDRTLTRGTRPSGMVTDTRSCNDCNLEIYICNAGTAPVVPKTEYTLAELTCNRRSGREACVEPRTARNNSCVAVVTNVNCFNELSPDGGGSSVLLCWKARLTQEKIQLAQEVDGCEAEEQNLTTAIEREQERLAEMDDGDCPDGNCRNSGASANDVYMAMINRQPTTLDYIGSIGGMALGALGMGLNTYTTNRGMRISRDLNRTAMAYQDSQAQAAINAYRSAYGNYTLAANEAGQAVLPPNQWGGMYGANMGGYGNPYAYGYQTAGMGGMTGSVPYYGGNIGGLPGLGGLGGGLGGLGGLLGGLGGLGNGMGGGIYIGGGLGGMPGYGYPGYGIGGGIPGYGAYPQGPIIGGPLAGGYGNPYYGPVYGGGGMFPPGGGGGGGFYPPIGMYPPGGGGGFFPPGGGMFPPGGGGGFFPPGGGMFPPGGGGGGFYPPIGMYPPGGGGGFFPPGGGMFPPGGGGGFFPPGGGMYPPGYYPGGGGITVPGPMMNPGLFGPTIAAPNMFPGGMHGLPGFPGPVVAGGCFPQTMPGGPFSQQWPGGPTMWPPGGGGWNNGGGGGGWNTGGGLQNPWLQGSFDQSLGWNQQQMWQQQMQMQQMMQGGMQQDMSLAQANLRDSQTRYYQLRLQMATMGGGMGGGIGGGGWWSAYGGVQPGVFNSNGSLQQGTSTPIGTPTTTSSSTTTTPTGSGTSY